MGVLLQLGRTTLLTLTVDELFIYMGALRMDGQQLETWYVLVIRADGTLCTDMITAERNVLVEWYLTDALHTGMPWFVATRCIGMFVLTSGNLNAKS